MDQKNKIRVVVAMSGGVDSSVAAYLLKEEGYEVIGVTIKTWGNDECKDERSKGCCSIRDIDDARSVARKLNIPYYVMDLSGDFKKTVIDYFVDDYLAGRTPNPCVECNRTIKFGLLLDKAKELGADYVATGHYARKERDEKTGRSVILQGVDDAKDQSYVLFGLTQEQLSKILLPIGQHRKNEIRAIAQEMGMRVFDKPDSQEICFVKKSYVDFVKDYAPNRLPGTGEFVDLTGKVLGHHEGSHLYTIGQRKRIQITDIKPYFVVKVDASQNRVVVGREEDLYEKKLLIQKMNWLLEPSIGQEYQLKIRYKTPSAPAKIVSIQLDEVEVEFMDFQKAITPGQAAVLYDGPRVVGGGWIKKVYSKI